MTTSEIIEKIEGADRFVDWFGEWPSFHDAEVLDFAFSRSLASVLRVHVFRMSSEVTASGHYRTFNHAVVSFQISEVLDGSLDGFNHQNVIGGLSVEEEDTSYRLVLWACYGLAGSLFCKDLSISFQAGVPTENV